MPLSMAPPPKAVRWLRTALASAAGTVALVSMLGKALGSPNLAAFGRGLTPMSSTVAGLLLLQVGAILLRDIQPETKAFRWVPSLLALVVALLTLGLATGHALGDFRLEQWLTFKQPQAQLSALASNMALLGVSSSALVLWWPRAGTWGTRQLAAGLAMLPLMIGPVVLVSYLAQAPMLYGSDRFPMSLPSALGAVALGVSMLLAAGCDTWPLAALGLLSRKRKDRAAYGFSWRVTIGFLLLVALILTGGSYYLRGQIRKTREQVRQELSTIADFKAGQIGNWWSERLHFAERIQHGRLLQPQFHRFLSGSPLAPSEEDVHTWMLGVQKGIYSQVTLFDGQGRARLTVPGEAVRSGVPTVAEIRAALLAKDVLACDLHLHPGDPEVQLSMWVPIQVTPDSAPAGALFLKMDPRKFLYPLVQFWPTASPTAETLLVRREGNDVLYLNEPRHRASAPLDLRLPLAAHPELPAARAILGEQGLVEERDYRGVAVLAMLRRVPGTSWFMVAKVDAAEVYGPLRRSMWLGGIALMGLVLAIGAWLGLMLRHHDADMVLKQLHLAERFELIMREGNDIILVLDDQGRILEANTRAVEHYGYGPEELVHMSVSDLRPRDTRAEAKGNFDQALAKGSVRFESVHCRKDGCTFPVEVSSRVVTFDGERRVISFIRDITRRRAQERELQRMSYLYAALSQVNQAIVWSPDRQSLLDKICEVLVAFGHFDMAWIGWNDPQSHRVSVAARYGDTSGYLDRIQVESGDSIFAQGPVGMAIREACPCVVNDFLNASETKPWQEAATHSGYRSMAAFPIRLGGTVVAALAVYASEKDFFGSQEAELLVEAAGDITFALDHLAAEARRREVEAALQVSERFLSEAQAAGRVGTYHWSIQEDHWTSSAFLDQILGIGPDYCRDLKGWNNLVAPEFHDKMGAYVADIMARHERFDLDYPIVRVSDGASRWVHGRGEIRWDAAGIPLAMVGSIQDITERKLAERSLKKIEMALEQCPLSIVITDPEGSIEYVNPAFTATTGYAAAEAIGKNPRILRSPNAPAERYREMWTRLTRGEVWTGEFENVKKDGSRYIEQATIAPVVDEDGKITSYIAVKEDITRAKQEKEQRRNLEAQLQHSQKLESLGSLAGGVAHDMNNVLGAILGLASTLRDTADPSSPTVRSLDTIVNACLRGRGVVKGLLYFAHKDLQEEGPVDLNALIQEMSQLLSYTMLKRVELRMDLQPAATVVLGDAGALSHALMNLCVNAMDAMAAMPRGGILHLKIASIPGGGLELRVKDSGEGMAPDVLAKAIEPFFTTKPQGKGTGLGLAMVHGTMLAHEGAFDLHSQVGEGTEAILRFPASRVIRPTAAPAPVPAAPKQSQATLRILLVDDDELIRDSVGPMLEALGHEVTAATGGAEALRLLEGGLPVDLVILDMNMPGMNGSEALPLILALRPTIHVLMASGYSDQEIAPLLVGRPKVSSLRKPFSMKEIQAKIDDLGIRSAGSAPI